MGRKAAVSLTARQVQHEGRLGYIADGEQAGLNLQVAEGIGGIVRSWVFRFTSPLSKKRREMGLGSTSDRSLGEVRKLAKELRLQVLNGIDPIVERDKELVARRAEQASRITFEHAALQCVATKQSEWKNEKHKSQWYATLRTYVFPVLGALPVSEITTEHVLRVLDPIWLTKTETATRVRQRIEVVLDWAKARSLRSGDNPASLKNGLGQLLPNAKKLSKARHHPALPYLRVHEFVASLRTKRGVSPKALEFLLLTAARSGEVRGATWEEVDFATGIWTIPAHRMKAGREHRIPLSARALEIVQDMQAAKQGVYIFPATKVGNTLSDTSLLAIMRDMPDFANYVPHGLRSTFRDWAAETTNVANETLELALAHTIKNKAEAAYRRQDQLDKRAKLMQQWQQYIETPKTQGSVIQLARKQDRQ